MNKQHPIEYIEASDPRFPPLLKHLSDPPKGLFVRGNLKDQPAISMVGTRRCSSYGRRATVEIVSGIVANGLGVISGLALGIDGEAHKAALDSGGYTIAVLATGIDDDTIYPREHLRLAHRILENGGALVSEYPPMSPSFKYAFPKRNRIIAGFTPATIVVEATPDSGSLITARLALEENREVLAVPGPIFSETSIGCHELIKLGAKPCTSAEDIMSVLKLDRPELMTAARSHMPLTPDESVLLGELSQARHIDELSAALSLQIGRLSGLLSFLELKGYVQHEGGQIWRKKAFFAKTPIK
ncbi:MAG: DNA-processing protein DprA [Candidatus Uhrbacteria bacterium]